MKVPHYYSNFYISQPLYTYLHNMINYAVAFTGRVNRNAHRLFVPQVNTNYGKRSLHYRGPTIWNALSTALYSATTLIHFQNV